MSLSNNAYNWLYAQLEAAQASLMRRGIPKHLLETDLCFAVIQPHRAMAALDSNEVVAAEWWAIKAYLENNVKGARRLLRHELGHILVNRCPELEQEFSLPEYPSTPTLYWRYLCVGLGLMKYGDVHPEEQLCEDIADLRRPVLNKVLCAVN